LTGLLTEGAAGVAKTFTVIAARGLSPHAPVCVTYQVVLPAVVVDGVGAVALPVPPVGTVYHNKPVPVAVSGTAVAFWQ